MAGGYHFEVRGSRFEVRGSRFEVRGSRFTVFMVYGTEVVTMSIEIVIEF
jgi:hypothetical protein